MKIRKTLSKKLLVENNKQLSSDDKLVNKVISKIFYFIPDLIDLEDDNKYDKIITYILTELDKVDVEKFKDRQFAYFSYKIAKKFKLKVDPVIYNFITAKEDRRIPGRELDVSQLPEDIETVEGYGDAMSFINKLLTLIPGIPSYPDEAQYEMYDIITEEMTESGLAGLTDRDIVRIARRISNELEVYLDEEALERLENPQRRL